MKITNKHSLPAPVYNFLARDRYQAGDNDISVTTLIKPPQIVRLEKEHYDELEVDALDLVWSLVGNGVHSLLDAHTEDGAMNEQRFYLTVDGVCIGGQVDHYRDGVITDYKVTSAYSVAYGNTKPEWEEQLNLYAYIMGHNGIEVKALRICAILRDWDKHRAKREAEYPQTPIQIISIPMWNRVDTVEFIHEKLVEMYAPSVRECTAEEMWEAPTKYAVTKKGNKRAYRVLDTLEEAETIANETGYLITERKGERKRCAEYCSVSAYCPQYQKYLEDLKQETEG